MKNPSHSASSGASIIAFSSTMNAGPMITKAVDHSASRGATARASRQVNATQARATRLCNACIAASPKPNSRPHAAITNE
ncbi:MAG TPA: hypothetical protein VGL58_19295 [Caulobacteraceae bacterium]